MNSIKGGMDMPLPFVLGAGAAISTIAGIGSGIHGAVEVKDANNTMKLAQERHQRNLKQFEQINNFTNKQMDKLGKLELQILNDFHVFSDTIGKIQNRPQFKKYPKSDVELPDYNEEELEKVSIRAGALLAGLGGAALGTAGGFAAAGAATSAIIAVGTASTGTAISTLSGAAATNATLAVLGGGSIAAGGGGIALGTTILNATTFGVGLLVSGTIFNVIGGKLSDQADEAYAQSKQAEKICNTVCGNLIKIANAADTYYQSLNNVYDKYRECFEYVFCTVNKLHKEDWNIFTDWEKKVTQNAVLLVGLLYKMCQVSLVKKGQDNEMNTVNKKEVEEVLRSSAQFLKNIV